MTPQPGERASETTDERTQREGASPNQQALLYIGLGLAVIMLLTMLYQGWDLLTDEQKAGRSISSELIPAPPTPVSLGVGSELTVDPAAGVPPVGYPPGPPPAISPTFQGVYAVYGERVLGWPMSPTQYVNGREIQWFERARLEHWPEHAGTPYEVQLGRLGVEFTQGREFARQSYFVSRPGLRYFPETGHAVEGLFLDFWEQNGGLDTLGLPISEAFDEVLADGFAYRVQYFERARIEYHPELAGSTYMVQLGRLGAALLSNEARPNTVQPVPTAVPMP